MREERKRAEAIPGVQLSSQCFNEVFQGDGESMKKRQKKGRLTYITRLATFPPLPEPRALSRRPCMVVREQRVRLKHQTNETPMPIGARPIVVPLNQAQTPHDRAERSLT